MKTFMSLLLTMALIATPVHASDILNLDHGIKIELPKYEHKRSTYGGSVCVDIKQQAVAVTVCFVDKPFANAAQDNGFYRYGDLADNSKSQLPTSPEDAIVYIEGSYNWPYQTSIKRIGDFNVYEASNVLCRDEASEPATCYAAGLTTLKSTVLPISIFVGSTVEKPPEPSGHLSRNGEARVHMIHEILEQMKIRP